MQILRLKPKMKINFEQGYPIELQINNEARTFQRVTTAVSDKYGIQLMEITGASKRHECVQARRIVCKVLFQLGWSYSRIGRNMDRDHTSVRSLISNPRDQITANRIETELRSMPNILINSIPTGIKTFSTIELLRELIRRDDEVLPTNLRDTFFYGDDS